MAAVEAYFHQTQRYFTALYYDLTTNGPPVKFTLPERYFFKFPPASFPQTVPPPADHPTLAHPFTIPTNWYNALLSPNVPIVFALVYASVVVYLNSLNSERNHKPWAFSQTGLFKLLVITHNAFLAIYSAWTFIGMINAVSSSFAGWRGDYGIAGAVDSLCKVNGPRGMGDAATFNETTSSWGLNNRLLHLAPGGLNPESSDVGRLWNEGLAFYGFLFYLSKLYEVIDTFIILSKGRESSFLQTYHHFGAILCMWAGIRYMSPPIWMFILINSGIHAIMYTFYLVSALGYSVPKRAKKSLTTLQITQFVFGVCFAFLHLFIKYQIPTSVPYLYHLGDIASAMPSDASSVASTAIETASADWTQWVKKAAFRAAGREGPAERVVNDQGRPFGIDAIHAVQDFTRREETRYRNDWKWVNCLDTSGQSFAVLLNILYLAPLTVLFIKFFATAYQKRLERRRSSTTSEKARQAFYASRDAAKGWVHHIDKAVNEMDESTQEVGEQDLHIEGIDMGKIRSEARGLRDEITQEANSAGEYLQEQFNKRFDTEKIQDEFNKDLQKFKEGAQHIKEEITNPKSTTRTNVRETSSKASENLSQLTEQAKEKTAAAYAKAREVIANAQPSDETKQQLNSDAETVQKKAKDTANQAAEKAGPAIDNAQKNVKETADKARANAGPAADNAKKTVKETADKAQANAGPAAEKAGKKAKETTNTAKAKGEDTANQASGSSKDLTQEGRELAASEPNTPSKSKDKSSGGAKKNGKQHADKDEKKKAQENGTKKGEGEREAADVGESPEIGTGSWVQMDEPGGDDESKKQSKELRDEITGDGGAGKGKGKGGKNDQEETEEDKKEKKREDKVIDDSQKLRDEEVDKDGKGKGEDAAGL